MNCNVLPNRITRRITAACALALAAGCVVALPARADKVTPPTVPFALKVDDGNHAFLVGHALGTQNYVCAPSATSAKGVAYVLFKPEATLYNDDGDQIITHYFSPNQDQAPPDPNTNPAVVADGAIRATWQHSRDGSTVWAKAKASVNVTEGAISWVLLDVVGTEVGLTGGGILTKTKQIQRLSTGGGSAPAEGCDSLADAGHSAFVPYTADYFFYTNE